MKTPQAVFKTILLAFMASALALNVWAASYDIKEMTPEVKSALESRRQRVEQLRSLKAQGLVGENNHGYVQVLKSEGDAEAVASAENNDRKVIYQTIVVQNSLPPDALATVEYVFAQVQRDKAASGDTIQDEAGTWVQK